uniref:Orfan n=1 Tax=Strongyloides venezuelensis TaxID=75913 RepID=A0A0K0F5E7_STRVS
MNTSQTIYIKRNESSRPAINNYYYTNDKKVDDSLPLFGVFLNFVSFATILFLVSIIIAYLIYTVFYKNSEKEERKVKDEKSKEDIFDRERNNMVRHFDRRNPYDKNVMDNNECPCKHRHLQPNIYQNSLENMIGYGQLVTTTFDKCLCKKKCEECTVKCRRPLNVPIINIEEHLHKENEHEKSVIIEKLDFVPCLRSHKECFISRK